MTRGMTTCRICGKPIPSIYRQYHEKYSCREMRRRRGDFLPKEKPKPPEEPKGLDLFIKEREDSG